MDTQKDTLNREKSVGSETGDTTDSLSALHSVLSVSGECLKRSERLSAALYMVTGLISDAEPIKWKMRERALAVIDDVSFMREMSVTDRVSTTERVYDTIAEITTLLTVAFAGDLLSEMNVSILKKEYAILQETVRKWEKEITPREGFVRDLFASDIPHPIGIAPFGRTTEKYAGIKGHMKDMYNGQHAGDTKGHTKDSSVHDERPIMSLRNEMSDRSSVAVTPFSESKNIEINQTIKSIKEERRKNIVAVIKRKKHVTIKDIAQIVHTVGEKTIQRELAAMVEEGVLKKEGEKRWSTYTMASD
ncbi:MAG: hypothetical protein HGA67_04285 [Candidatus Yonathbacteria bacterium]|nr:hypothetical protein [Candidatus Yonathbacteria bacterium]